MRDILAKFIVALAAISLSGCGVEDKAMPLDRSTVETFMVALSKKSQSEKSPSAGAAENIVHVYRDVVENDVGYSFDRTLNRALVVQDALSSALFNPLTVVVTLNSEHLKIRNVITSETAELVALRQAASEIELTPERTELFETIRRCRKLGGGKCDAISLTSLILESDPSAKNASNSRGYASSAIPSTPGDGQFALENYADRKYRISGIGGLCRTGIILTNMLPDVGGCGLIMLEGAPGVRAATTIEVDENKYNAIIKYHEIARRVTSDTN